ncbi:RagB/SusD family nutrient uptake outer membrane protein [Porphyromonas macacae]|uniref:RagB/SusD family nutrient uptake outer membrane protein n=1 Tax=Porphyromonas macacae TaxID=28115 RepID=UPI0024ACB90B|nr:RagB/SusD family nutrient uptake outer membrane protein [Porphyromonas macacae]
MKLNLKYICFALGVSLIATSCSGWLDREPSNATPTDEALNSIDLLDPMITGLFDNLQGSSSSTSYYAASFIVFGDVRGDDVQATQPAMRTSPLYEMRYGRSNCPNMWAKPYSVIRSANRLLQACDNLDKNVTLDADKALLSNARAQALAVRALAHFDLARIYSLPYSQTNGETMGVPLITEVIESKSLPERSKLSDVYKQVISDFENALKESGFPETSYGMMSKMAVRGLLSRVYLYMDGQEYNTKALELAEEVINSGKYTLAKTVEEYKTIWSNPASKEMIFTIVNQDTKDWADREALSYLYSPDGYLDAHITKKFYDELNSDPEDIRLNAFISSEGTDAEDPISKLGIDVKAKIWINKYPGKAGTGDVRTNDVPVIRLAEVYLNAAEAAVKLGNTAKAEKYLNTIVMRANPKNKVDLGNVNLDRILAERSKELVGEGFRFFDLMRNNKEVVRYKSIKESGWHYPLSKESAQFDNKYFRVILAIPEDEINANEKLKKQQNPGY